jgi:hypothetical protein
MSHRRKPLHWIQFAAGLATFPLAVWFYWQRDFLGLAFALIIGVMAVAYTAINLFVRPWP